MGAANGTALKDNETMPTLFLAKTKSCKKILTLNAG